jgi:hypothetical protein
MDLQQILSHRDYCILCQKKLIYFIPQYPKLKFHTDEKGFHIRSDSKSGIAIDLNYDGTYHRNKRNYKIYKEPITIIKGCQECYQISQTPPKDKSGKLISRPIAMTSIAMKPTTLPMSFHTSLGNIKSKECAYAFSFYFMGDNSSYNIHLQYDVIRHYDEEEFYHLDTSYFTKTSTMHHASFEKTLDQIFTLRLPNIVNLSNVKTTDQYLNKCRTIMTFS